MTLIFTLLVHLYLIVFSAGEECQMLEGLWYNENGAQLRLSHAKDGTLLGSYTAAEGELGINSASNLLSDIAGAAVYNQSGAVFSLSVLWMNGASIKAWIGQCLMCENDEVLQTSWLLRQRADNCSDKWLITSIGQTMFKRQYETNETKNVLNNQHYSPSGKRGKRSNHDTDATTIRPRRSCSLDGFWYNQLGSELFIAYHHNTAIRGEYRTAVEMSNGSAGANYSNVYGMANDLDASTAIALYVVWNNGNSVTGWVGQCHLCGPNQTETLVTTWLLRSKVNSYEENWSATRVGEDYFTREEQRRGPRKLNGTSAVGQTR